MNRILITGAAGKIGRPCAKAWRDATRCCALSDIAPLESGTRRRRDRARRSRPISPRWKPPCGASIALSTSARPQARTRGTESLPTTLVGTWNVFRGGAATRCASHHLCEFASRRSGSMRDRFIDQMVVPTAGRRLRGEQGVRRGGRRRSPTSTACRSPAPHRCLSRNKPADSASAPSLAQPARRPLQLVGCCIDAPPTIISSSSTRLQ